MGMEKVFINLPGRRDREYHRLLGAQQTNDHSPYLEIFMRENRERKRFFMSLLGSLQDCARDINLDVLMSQVCPRLSIETLRQH